MKALKYYSLVSTNSFEHAAKRLKQASDKHPDWEVRVLANMRGSKFTVARVQELDIDVPDVDSLDLPPLPQRPMASRNSQAYQDWEFEHRKRSDFVRNLMQPVLRAIREWPPSP